MIWNSVWIYLKMFIGLLSSCIVLSFSKSLPYNYNEPIKCVTLKNQPCQDKPALVNINSIQPLFYPFTVSVNKCGGSCNTIVALHARVYVPNKLKYMSAKAFNLMSKVNETRSIVRYESCECTCGLNESVCNSKQRFNHDECWCNCKELDDWGFCKNDYVNMNLSRCDCECNKACKTDECLDI